MQAECKATMFGNWALDNSAWTSAQMTAADRVRKHPAAFAVDTEHKDGQGFITAVGTIDDLATWRCVREPDAGTVSFNWMP